MFPKEFVEHTRKEKSSFTTIAKTGKPLISYNKRSQLSLCNCSLNHFYGTGKKTPPTVAILDEMKKRVGEKEFGRYEIEKGKY